MIINYSDQQLWDSAGWVFRCVVHHASPLAPQRPYPQDSETHRRTCDTCVTLAPVRTPICPASLAADRGRSGDQTVEGGWDGRRAAGRVAAILCAGTTRSESRSLVPPRKNSPSLALPPSLLFLSRPAAPPGLPPYDRCCVGDPSFWAGAPLLRGRHHWEMRGRCDECRQE